MALSVRPLKRCSLANTASACSVDRRTGPFIRCSTIFATRTSCGTTSRPFSTQSPPVGLNLTSVTTRCALSLPLCSRSAALRIWFLTIIRNVPQAPDGMRDSVLHAVARVSLHDESCDLDMDRYFKFMAELVPPKEPFRFLWRCKDKARINTPTHRLLAAE